MVGASTPSAGKGPCLERGDGNKCFSKNGQLGKGLGDFLLIPALLLGGHNSWEWHGVREIGNSWPLLSTKIDVPERELYSWGSLRWWFWSRGGGSSQHGSSGCLVTVWKGGGWLVALLSLVSLWGGVRCPSAPHGSYGMEPELSGLQVGWWEPLQQAGAGTGTPLLQQLAGVVHQNFYWTDTQIMILPGTYFTQTWKKTPAFSNPTNCPVGLLKEGDAIPSPSRKSRNISRY